MPAWIHARAEHIMAKNPSMPKGEAFAIATQQGHVLGKSPKSYGTDSGRERAKEKYKTPGDDQKKANPLTKNAEADQRFRSVNGTLLDASIPLVQMGKGGIEDLHKALADHKGGSSWSHDQIAVPKNAVDLSGLGFEKTRLAIPLPGESWGTPSYRHGELHAHEAGPFLLVHKDESAPGSGLLAHMFRDVPSALWKRLSGNVAPFVQENKSMANQELHKTAMDAFLEEYSKIADSTFAVSQYAGPMGTVPFQQASQLPAFRTPGLKTAIEKPQQKVASAVRSGKLPPVFSKEKGVLGRAKQLLSGERALALKTLKERYSNRAGDLARRADIHAHGGSPEYAHSLKRDAELTGRAAKRIGKIHGAEAAKSTAARVGVAGAAGAGGFAAGRASADGEKEAGALTPAGRLVSAQRKGTGMGATVTGPSIAEVAKPPRIGHALPGALKNQI